MTTVNRTLADVIGRPDYTAWEFETGLRRSTDDPDVTITPKRIKAIPEEVDGEAVLSVDLDPGPARVTYRGVSFIIEIPETGTADLQDLIEAGTVENGAPEIPSNAVLMRGLPVDSAGMNQSGEIEFFVRQQSVGSLSLGRFFVRFVDQNGDPLPDGSLTTIHVNTVTGDIDDITFEEV